jgi:cell division protein FtsZ
LRAAAQKAAPEQQARSSVTQATAPQQAADKPRFGINSLINRMTGHAEGDAQPQQRPVRQQPPVQQQPRVSAAPQQSPQPDAEEDRIEIPAFLRRQAN